MCLVEAVFLVGGFVCYGYEAAFEEGRGCSGGVVDGDWVVRGWWQVVFEERGALVVAGGGGAVATGCTSCVGVGVGVRRLVDRLEVFRDRTVSRAASLYPCGKMSIISTG